MFEKANDVLKTYWGYVAFRPGQVPIVEAALKGRDVLALLPTGGGKSLCFQVPGLVSGGLTLVISPLIALMDDQVEQLQKLGIKAYRIHAGIHRREAERMLDNCINGPISFLYISPERLVTQRFLQRLPHLPLTQVAIDEAHCISQWGHDFRPAYQQIKIVREYFPKVPVRAFTATATARVREDIIHSLSLKNPFEHHGDIYRSNLTLRIAKTEDRLGEILRYCQDHREQTGIVYLRNRKACMEVSKELRARGVAAAPYHAGLPLADREKAMADWLNDKVRVIVATNAFGMGIDKGEVRYVLHWQPPPDLESYYQEAGRAGRDGLPSEAILYTQSGDEKRMLEKWAEQYPDIQIVRQVYKMIAIRNHIAQGDQPEEAFPIDLRAIAHDLKAVQTQVYFALKTLQLGGYIEWEDGGSFRGSSVFIHANRDQMSFQREKSQLRSDLLHCLLRLYEGILDAPVHIREVDVAKMVKADIDTVQKELLDMEKEEVLDYIPATDLPRIRFFRPRVRASTLEFKGTKVEMIKAWQRDRLDQMLAYTRAKDCLYRVLARYFSVPFGENCGKCTYCTSSSRKRSGVTSAMLGLLKKGDMGSDELFQALNGRYEEKEVLHQLDQMLEEEMITFGSGKYRLKDRKNN